MTTYYNHTHMTAVPTRLLLDTNLSTEAKLTGALLYTFEDGGLSAQERGFARAVGADDAIAVAGEELQVNVLEQPLTAKLHTEIAYCNHFLLLNLLTFFAAAYRCT